jgi:serine protease AprX
MGTATREDDLIASYSSKGPSAVDHIVKPDLVAPGNQIMSLLAQHETLALDEPQNLAALNAYRNTTTKPGRPAIQPSYDPASGKEPPTVKVAPGYSKKYYVLSGTSMASAVVSGAAADLLQALPSLTPDQVKMLLMKTASKTFPTVSSVTDPTTGQTFTSYYDIFTVGAGYLDLSAALSAAKQIPTGVTAISPIANYDTATGNVDISFDPSSVFSDKAMWGENTLAADKALWGATATWSGSVLIGNKALWGASAVWGATSDTAANKALWGADAIWTNQSLWGASTASNSLSVMVDGEQ